jgi:BlaI family transcriptional regulator, penicillinase repressor
MTRPLALSLSRRERQIMDVLHRLQRASAAQVQAEMPDPPSYSAVRAHLRILEDKGHLRHIVDGPRYLFEPTAEREEERASAMRHLVRTFFNGSTEDAMVALLDTSDTKLSKKQKDDLLKRIADARKEGR